MRRIIASDFRHYIPEGAGERRNTYIELGQFLKNQITAEFRCASEVVVSAVDADGQTVFLGEGKIVYLDGVFDGFVSLEVNANAAYCYWIRTKGRFLEVPDPIPAAVTLDQPVDKPIADLVAEHVRKYLAAKELDSSFQTDEAVEELIDDIQQGDLDFEAEPDPFGLGYEERLREFEAETAQQAPQAGAQGAPDPSGPVGAAESEGPQSAEKPASGEPGTQITT